MTSSSNASFQLTFQRHQKLKTQIKHFESLEEELKKMRAKNNDLQDNYLTELNRNRSLASQLEEIKLQVRKQKELGNGDIEGEDAFLLGRGRHERTKLKGHGSEASVSKHTSRELSPQHKRERLRNREFALSNEHYSLSSKQASSPVFTNSREKVKSRGGTRTALFENDKNAAIENDSVKPTRPSSNAIEFPDANCAGVKNQRPFSPREALRSRAIIKPVIIDKDVKKIMGGSGTEVVLEKQKSTSKSVTSKVTSSITIYPSDSSGPRAVPSEAPRERHTSTSNIQVGPPELTAISNHVSSPLELSIHKHDITLQLTEAERVGDGSPKNRAEMVVSRSSILIKPSESVEKNSHVPPAETIRWKSHSASSDSRHITVRNAWKSKRDLKCSEDPPTGIGRNMEATNAYTQRPCTDFLELEQPRSQPSEQGARRVGNSGDAPELSPRRTQSSLTASEVLTRRDRMGGAITAASCNHSSSMEEGEDSTFVTSRRIHNPLEHSELPGKQGLPEPEPVWTEERLHPAKPYAEED